MTYVEELQSYDVHGVKIYYVLKIFSQIIIIVKRILNKICKFNNFCNIYIWGVSRQLPQRAARKPQIVLFLTYVYDTRMYFEKLFDKRFRCIFSSAFQWCRQFFWNFPFWSSKTLSNSISHRKHLGHASENILSYVKNAQLSI